MKTESEASAILAEFEDRCGAYGLTVRGVSVWRLIRAPVGYLLQDLPFSAPSLPWVDLFSVSIRSFRDLSRRAPRKVRYIVKSYASAMRISGVLGVEDVYFEELLRQEVGGVRLSSLNVSGKEPCGNSAIMSLDCTLILVLGVVMARLFPVRDGREVFERLGRDLETALGLATFSSQRIARMFSTFWWQSKLFERLLKRLGPRVVITADSGERALIAACHRLGVRIVEMQHGVFTPDDPDCLPATALRYASDNSLLLPDVLAIYGAYWGLRHKDTAMGQAEKLCLVGAAIIDRYRNLREILFRPDSDCPRLIVTSQGLDRDRFIQFLADFLAQFNGSCRLCIKLHPVYDLSPQPYLSLLGADSRVQVVIASEGQNTFELIASSDLHISIASACHYDSIGIGCPTVVLGLAGHEVVFDLVQTGNALFAATTKDLVEIVEGRLWKNISNAESEYFFRSEFVKNMSELIA